MSVYVGIDVHRKRSQVAVVAEDVKVQLNRNVVNGQEPMLRLIGGLQAARRWHSSRPTAGGGWWRCWRTTGPVLHMVHPLRCKAIASARLKNDLLTELAGRSFRWCVRSPVMLARFRPRDQRRGYAAGVVRAGGAAARLA